MLGRDVELRDLRTVACSDQLGEADRLAVAERRRDGALACPVDLAPSAAR